MPDNPWVPDSIEDWRAILGGLRTIITLLDEHFVVINQFNAEQSPLSVKVGQAFSDQLGTLPHIVDQALQQTLDSNEPQVLETLHPNDSSRILRHEMHRLKTSTGQTMIAIYSTEISESTKKDAGERVRTQYTDEPFRALVDIMPAIVIWIDLDEHYLYVNRYVANRTGIPQEEFVGRKITEITKTEASLLQWRGQIADVLEARKPITVEYTYTWKGVVGHNLITVVPVMDENGTITSVFSHSVELAKIFEREEALRRANIQAEHAAQAKDRFIANVSHELRTPLNVILGFAGLLRENVGHVSQAQDYLDQIIDSGHYLTRLVGDMLDASQIDVGQFALDLSVVDLHQLLRRITRSQTERARAKGLTFAVEVQSDTEVWLIVDETRLRQIINNLVDNAIKYTDSGGVQLRVSYAPDEQTLHMEVLDTGIGIPESHVEDIFEAFVTLGMSNKESGVGLGLYITRSLVELMGGTIAAENRASGGAVFRVAIPLQQAPPETRDLMSVSTLPVRISGELGQYRAMLVEDTPANAALVAERLTRWGFAVDVVNDEASALERLRMWQPHLILLDLYMPSIDGFTLAGQIRADSGLRHIPIIALTASAISSDHERAKANGVDVVLTKPIRFDVLANAAAACLKVEFLYEASIPVSAYAPLDGSLDLSIDDLRHLPKAWLQQMYFAAATASPNATAALIETLEDVAPNIAAKLRELAAVFNFSMIADLIETILDEHDLA